MSADLILRVGSGAVLIAALAACAQPSRDGIVLITIDTWRLDSMGAFAGDDVETPVLDRLAREGVRARAYTPIPLTTPAHATMLTGLHPATHGLRNNGQQLPLETTTLAELLREAGYATGAVAAAMPLHPHFQLHQGFDAVEAGDFPGDGFRAGTVTEAAIAVVDRLVDERAGAPVFLWVHYFDAHSAYDPPPPFDRLYGASGSGEGSHEAHNRVIYGGEAVTPEFLARNRSLYQGEVAYVDDEIGRLLEELEARGFGEALVVVVGDHGESFRPDYPFDHADRLYDEILTTPLVIRGGGIPARTDLFPAAFPLEDVMPTVLELRGLPVPEGLDGESRAGELLGREPPRETPVFAECPRVKPRPEEMQSGLNAGAMRAVQLGPCKVVWNLDRREAALYDLEQDPEERDNLLDSTYAGRCDARALHRLYLEWASVHPAALTQAPPAGTKPVPPDIRERLRTLGYTSD